MSDAWKVIVIGDTCDDEYVYGTVDRISPEAPVSVLKYTRSEKTKGMAANVNNNLRSLGVATDLLTQKESIVKTRFIDENSGYQLMRMDEEVEVTPISAAQLKSSFIHFGGFDAMVISDYGKGFVPEDRMMEIMNSFNGPIFVEQGKALRNAASDVQVCVVGNPCNTNALIALHNCRDIPAQRFAAMTALDENRAKALLASKSDTHVDKITHLAIWGNHSTTMYPDFENTQINGQNLPQVINDRAWLENDFIPRVQNRGAEIIQARGLSSAASAASACLDHIRNMSGLNKSSDWFSAAVASDGEHYNVPKGLFFSFPLTKSQTNHSNYEIIKDIELSNFAKARIKTSTDELLAEREVIKDLLA